MVSNFRLIFLLMCLSVFPVKGQVSVNLSLKPPFTPFISDYTNPARLQDINVALFNESGSVLRLKFKLTLTNRAKGIEISVKESVNPINPLELQANEFKFVVLEDVSNLYGKLDQNSFNIAGADIQNLILDGTMPDGIYEVCIQAFDFDAPGFTKPLSGSSPMGCFNFQINYTDPPTDIRFNNQLLFYSFGGNVPKIGVNKQLGQNYNIQFTSPALNIGSSLSYELMIFENTSIDPRLQQERAILEAINTIQPIIRKTSSIPFFTIDPGDIELDFNKDYFLLIKAEDLNEKTVFKNKGYSTFKAFRLIDVSPVLVSNIEFTNPLPGAELNNRKALDFITWENGAELDIQNAIRANIETRVKIIRLNHLTAIPQNIFNSNIGELLLDQKYRYDTASFSGLLSKINTTGKFDDSAFNNNLRWVIAVQHSIIPGREFTSHIVLANNGFAQTDAEFNLDKQTTAPGVFTMIQHYPVDNDTLPFHYPPVVFKMQNTTQNDKIVFTQFNSKLEPVESYKHMKLTTDANVNSQLNLINADTVLNKISEHLNNAAIIQMATSSSGEHDALQIAMARDLLNNSNANFRVQVMYALNGKILPLGNGSNGKMALLNNMMRYHSAAQYMNVDPVLDFPNLGGLIYVNPFKNNIIWTAKVGIYNPNLDGGTNVRDYADFFHYNEWRYERDNPNLRESIKTGGGRFNTGMKTPKILGTQIIKTNDSFAKVNLSFMPSQMPIKLLPDLEGNDAWKEFQTMSVAQQWNVEIARDRSFALIDTVVSKRIVKQYDIKNGTAPIIADLYTKVDLPISVYDTGKYYWRVTWSNVTLEENAAPDKLAYFRNLANMLATAQLMGQDEAIDFDSIFFIRKNYKVSSVDSFTFKSNTKPSVAKIPAFEVVYPMPGDTIPFYYPPVIIKKNPLDTAYKFALTKFNSSLEPFLNHNYFLLDQNHAASIRLRSLSFDSSANRLTRDFDRLANEQLFEGGNALGNPSALTNDFISQNIKRTHLSYYNSGNTSLLPLGNSAKGKLNLIHLVLTRSANLQEIGAQEEGVDIETPSLSRLVYFKPYKSVDWSARLAYYYPYGSPFISVDSFENSFADRRLGYLSPISIENRQGLAFLNGSFHVGMKTPIITTRLNGKRVPSNQLDIRFKPSETPQKPFPDSETGEAWEQWRNLFVAQQWNIEFSNTPDFDSIIHVHSKCLIEQYDIKNDRARVMTDFYSERSERVRLNPGKYFYRITWSNPTLIDSADELHKGYFEMQTGLMAADGIAGNDEENNGLTDYFSLKRENYRFSAIDSVVVTDSASSTDTAVCGLACLFNMSGVSTVAASGHVRVNDEVSVGQFTMKIKSVSENLSAKTFSGTGSISTKLFASPISVVFSDIKFNAQKRMVAGTVKALHKNDQILNSLSNDSSGSLLDKIQAKLVQNVTTRTNALIDEANDSIKSAIFGPDEEGEELQEIYNYLNSPVNLLVDALSGQDITLPFGLSREVDNYPHTIAITDIVFSPTEATFNAAAILLMDIPEFRQYLGFGASGLCLTPQGLGGMSTSTGLELMGSVKIPMGEGYGYFTVVGRDMTELSGAFGNTGTRILWGCKGFQQVDLKVSVDINRNVAMPVENGKYLKNQRVKAIGHGVFGSLNNWMLSLEFDKDYEFSFLPGFTMRNRIVALDFSDVANPQGMVFPTEYVGDKGNTWQGLYIKDLGVRLPNIFNEKDTIAGLGFTARDIIFDKTGITGTIAIDNLLSLEQGTLAGWKYSIDRFAGTVVQGTSSSLSMNGRVGVPVFEGNLAYSMLFAIKRCGSFEETRDSMKISLSIQPQDELQMPAMFASVNLLPSSKVELIGRIFDPKSLRLQSNFNGSISLGADNIAGMKDVRFGTLPFEGLKLRTAFYTLDSFKFSLDRLGGMDMNRLISDNQDLSGSSTPVSTGEQKTGGFPITLEDFGLDTFSGVCTFDLDADHPGPRIGIKLKVMVNVADAGGNAIGGSCVLGLYMGVDKNEGFFGVSPKGLNIDTIRVNASLNGAVTIAGGIAFMANDPVYGNGIAGFVLAKTPVLSVGVSGMFGEVNRMRYWMFGAKAEFPPIPIDFSANVIYANSFSGEFWYKMNRTPGSAADQAAGFQIGKSPSGASFVPAADQLFGFGAALGLTGPPGSPLFGDVGLYAQINANGGLSKLTIEGNLWMTNNDKMTAPLLINGNATIDVDNQKFIGMMSALVNVGGGAVRGRTTQVIESKTYYLAGTVDFLVDFKNNNWHLKLGNPFLSNNRLGFGFYAGTSLLFEAGGYFMMGNQLPQQMPPMEPSLVSKLQQAGISVSGNKPSSGGTGFVILAGVDANIPEKKVELGSFYAGIAVQFALDGMMKPQDLNCQGRNGIEGWYITGRAYAVMNGALGIHVDLPFYKGDIIAAELNAAMMLDAGLMNPYYFKGQFAANYSVLGGLIEGSKTFSFELAEDDRCKPNVSSSSVAFGAILADVKPAKDATDVIVGAEPSIALNFPLNKETSFKVVKVVNGVAALVTEKIRVKYEYIRLRDDGTMKTKKIHIIPSSDGLDIVIRPDSFLRDGSTFHTLSARFFVEKYNSSNSKWEVVKKKNGSPWDTSFSIRFRTEAEASFQSDYISYSIPRAGERYFKKGDYSIAKIVCKQNSIQSTFFTGTLAPSGSFRQIQLSTGYNVYYGLYARAGNPSDTVRVPLTFYNNEIRFPLPTKNDTLALYQFRIIKERIPGMQLAESNVPNSYFNSGGVMVRKRTATMNVDRRLIMHAFVFKVSKFNTMNSKIAQVALQTSAYAFPSNQGFKVIAKTSEPFEEFELKSYSMPLLNGSVTLSPRMLTSCSNNAIDDNNWMIKDYRPRVFKAGDSLQKKRTSLTFVFQDRTKLLLGSNIIFDEHVLKPLPVNSLAFSYDLRLADNQILNLNSQLLQINNLNLSGVSVNDNSFMLSNNLSLDPVNGTISSGPNLNTGIQPISTSTSTAPQTPAIGSRLHIDYTHFYLMAADFNRLKTLANNIINTNPAYWMMDLTAKERELVLRVRRTDYLFRTPTSSNKFAIALHPISNNNAPVKKLLINSNILELLPIVTYTSNTTFTSFGLK